MSARAAASHRAGRVFMWAGLLGLVTGSLSAGDIYYHSLEKGAYYYQPASSAPELKVPFGRLLRADLLANTNRTLSVQLHLLNAIGFPVMTRGLPPLSSHLPGGYTHVERFDSQAALDTAWPAGRYAFEVNGLGWPQGCTNWLSSGFFPSAPEVTNLVAAQSMDPAAPFTLRWAPFAGGTTNDFIYFQLQNATGTVFATSYIPRATNALDGTATSVVVPPGALSAGCAYLGRLIFHKFSVVVSNSFPGALGAYGYFAQTDFFVATTGGSDVSPPILLSTEPANGASGVFLNQPISFRFNETMNGSRSLSYNTLANFRSGWSPDGRELAATTVYSNLAAGRLHYLILNPFHITPRMADTNGNLLAADTTLVFSTGNDIFQPAPPVLDPPVLAAGASVIQLIQGTTNYGYALLVSSNLSNWVKLTTNVAFEGRAVWTNPSAAAAGSRFYRALAQ